MRGSWLLGRAFAAAALYTLAATGCQPAGRRSEPGAARVIHGGSQSTGISSDRREAPGGLSLFGDRPEYEDVPFENRVIANLARHSFTTDGLDFDPDVCDRFGLLVFASTRNSERPDIFLKSLDGTALTQLTSDPADDIQPRFSPDGDRIAFCSNRGGSWDIWMTNRDGTEFTQLTRDPGDEVAPSWSPDGTQIAYSAWGSRSHQWEIWTLATQHPGIRRFLAYGMFPAWSPDGKRIALQRARQRGSHLFSIWTIDLADGEALHPTEVAHEDAAACIAPSWSPDGALLVYCVVPDGPAPPMATDGTPSAADLWVVELRSGLRMRLTDGAEACFNPAWARDGRVFFVSARSGTENIWSLTTELGSYAGGRPDPARTTTTEQDATSAMSGN